MPYSQKIIDAAMAFPMQAVVERYASEQDLPLQVAEEHAVELRRYLALCAMNPTAAYGMRGPIDELWHTFIIFTQDYSRFCDQVVGRFLHHAPGRNDREETQEGVGPAVPDGFSIREGYEIFLAEYEQTYGQPAPPHLWPRPMKHERVEARLEGCGCGTCYCHGGGCSCVIAIADRPQREMANQETLSS